MSIKLYMDVHGQQAITRGLRQRAVEVLTAQEEGARRFTDSDLLDRATVLARVLFSQDEDLLREATWRQRQGQAFAGVIYAHQERVSIGQCIQDLDFLAKASEPEDFANRVEHLSLK